MDPRQINRLSLKKGDVKSGRNHLRDELRNAVVTPSLLESVSDPAPNGSNDHNWDDFRSASVPSTPAYSIPPSSSSVAAALGTPVTETPPRPIARNRDLTSPPSVHRHSQEFALLEATWGYPTLTVNQVYLSQQLVGVGMAPRSVGPPHLQIYTHKVHHPLVPILHTIKHLCEEYAFRSKAGWRTNLYSLTQQDVALADVPGAASACQPLTDFVLGLVSHLYGKPANVDRNQPHVLRYDENHTSVPLHYDRCHVTVSIMMSARSEYRGGGTYLPALGDTLILNRGDMLLHPGSVLHGGSEITAGTRYLLIYFCQLNSGSASSMTGIH